MSDLLGSASDWLEGQRHQFLTRQITYYRGPLAQSVAATVDRSEFQSTDSNGFTFRIETRDYLILSDELQGGAPEPGDRILEGTNTYQVMPPQTGIPAWRYSDINRKTFRVHTQLVSGG